jgi:transposase
VAEQLDKRLPQTGGEIANGLIEGINSLVQAAKAKARGYRSTRKGHHLPDCRQARSQATHMK